MKNNVIVLTYEFEDYTYENGTPIPFPYSVEINENWLIDYILHEVCPREIITKAKDKLFFEGFSVAITEMF